MGCRVHNRGRLRPLAQQLKPKEIVRSMQTDKVCSFKLLLVCDGLLLLENKVVYELAAIFDAKLKHDRPWAFPKLWSLCTTLTLRTTLQGRVLSHAHPTRPSRSVALPVVRADRVPCNTVRLQVEPPNILRAREEVHRHFSISICYVDRRKLGREKDGYMRRKAQLRCTRRAGCGRKSTIGPRSGNSVSHPRVEKSAFQEMWQ